MPPHFGNDPHPEKSLVFLLANLNKRGVTLNLRRRRGRDLLRAARAQRRRHRRKASRRGYLASLGLDYEALARENPGLIMVSITPFGQTGPYSGYESEEIVTYALSGIMSISGTADREPLKHGGMQSQFEGGLNGALATIVALYARDLTGEGQHVDVSLQDVVDLDAHHSPAVLQLGRRRPGPAAPGRLELRPGPALQGRLLRLADRRRRGVERHRRLLRVRELKEERFSTVAGRTVHGEELDRLVLDATKDRTMQELFRTASEKYHMLFGIVQEPEDLARCPHLERASSTRRSTTR